jgi:HD-like signal output (HDOD) protein
MTDPDRSLAVLFVDDETNILQGLRRMLHSMRCEWRMEFVSSGPEALQALERGSFDAIVSDMRMPDMNGAQLLGEVRKRFPHVARFILSGHAERELVVQTVGSAHQYLAKPSEAEVLKEKLRRAANLRGILADERLARLASQVDALPSDPDAVRKLHAELDAKEPCIERIGQVIEADVGMSAKVLQLVSSSFFGLPRGVPEPTRAASLLGHDVLKSLATSAAAFSAANDAALESLDFAELSKQSLACASRAREWASVHGLNREVVEQAFVAGLLHDAGKLVLAASEGVQYRAVLDLARQEGIPVWEAERRHLGAHHAEVGAYLLGLWGLPAGVVDAVAYHHAPQSCPRLDSSLVAAVSAALVEREEALEEVST